MVKSSVLKSAIGALAVLQVTWFFAALVIHSATCSASPSAPPPPPIHHAAAVPTSAPEPAPPPLLTAAERGQFVELAKRLYIHGRAQPLLPIWVCGQLSADEGYEERRVAGDLGSYDIVADHACFRAIFQNAEDARTFAWMALASNLNGLFNGAEGPAYDLRIDLVITRPGTACDWENATTCPHESR